MSESHATGIIEFLKPRLNRRSVAFLLCLLLSGMFWLLTALSKEYTEQFNIPIRYTDLPEDRILANEPMDKLTVKVKGLGFDLLWYKFDLRKAEIRIPADPNRLSVTHRSGDELHYVLTEEQTGNISGMKDDQLQILKVSPDTLFLLFRPRFTRTLPVKLNAQITYAKQYGPAGPVIIEPETVEVTGLKELVMDTDSVLTQKLVWTDLNETVSEEVELLNEHDPRLLTYVPSAVLVTVNVVKYTEGSVTIPVRVRADGRTVRVYPSEITVKYQVALSDFDRVKPDMFAAEVVLSEETQHNDLLSVSLTSSPALVRQIRIEPPQVEYIVQQ